MTEEKRAKVKALRDKLANLTPAEREAISARGMIATVEGRTLSLHNTMMVAIQAQTIPTVAGGYQQWRKAGKQVRKGEHGYTIFFPVGPKSEDGETLEAERFFMGTVFDISQVEKAQ